jgi:hypothetical protein
MTIVNLIDKRSGQGELGNWLAYCLFLAQNSSVDLLHSDPTGSASVDKSSSSAGSSASEGRRPRVGDQASLDMQPGETLTQWKQRVRAHQALREKTSLSPSSTATTQVTDSSTSSAVGFMRDNDEDVYKKDDELPVSFLAKHQDLLDRLTTSVHKYSLTVPTRDQSEVRAMKDRLDVKLVWYDYHKKSSHSSVGGMKEIWTQVRSEFDANKAMFVQLSESEDPQMQQQHLIRTNCIDCLDRTNVVQVSTTIIVIIITVFIGF